MPDDQAMPETQAVIKVVGVGGGGGDAIEYMLNANLGGVEFIDANTDAQRLSRSKAPAILRLGQEVTKGLGAGGNPELGKLAAYEERERIESVLKDSDMVFILAGMGGGTGTGAAPVIAEIARAGGALTVAVVTRPFPFEGMNRQNNADTGIAELKNRVDSMIIIPNERVLTVMGDKDTLPDAFNKVNEVQMECSEGRL